MPPLNAQNAHIFRITHIKNVPWILSNGLYCKSNPATDPHFVPIGMPELIAKRATRTVPIPPGGLLADYVPFYFTPHSIMLLNIKSGRNGVIKRPWNEIVILVSSLPKLKQIGRPFVFTNGHAYMEEAEYFDDLADLGKIDWNLLQKREFSRTPEDPGKMGRYQAEALVHQHVPVSALIGIACYDSQTQAVLTQEIAQRNLTTPVKTLPDWYFK